MCSALITISVVSWLIVIGIDKILSSSNTLSVILNKVGGSLTPCIQNVITVSSVYSSISGLYIVYARESKPLSSQSIGLKISSIPTSSP